MQVVCDCNFWKGFLSVLVTALASYGIVKPIPRKVGKSKLWKIDPSRDSGHLTNLVCGNSRLPMISREFDLVSATEAGCKLALGVIDTPHSPGMRWKTTETLKENTGHPKEREMAFKEARIRWRTHMPFKGQLKQTVNNSGGYDFHPNRQNPSRKNSWNSFGIFIQVSRWLEQSKSQSVKCACTQTFKSKEIFPPKQAEPKQKKLEIIMCLSSCYNGKHASRHCHRGRRSGSELRDGDSGLTCRCLFLVLG